MKSSRAHSSSTSPLSESVGAPSGARDVAEEHEAVPDHQSVSERARALWRERGCPVGRDEEIWLEAERQLNQAGRASVSTPSGAGRVASTRRQRRGTNAS